MAEDLIPMEVTLHEPKPNRFEMISTRIFNFPRVDHRKPEDPFVNYEVYAEEKDRHYLLYHILPREDDLIGIADDLKEARERLIAVIRREAGYLKDREGNIGRSVIIEDKLPKAEQRGTSPSDGYEPGNLFG